MSYRTVELEDFYKSSFTVNAENGEIYMNMTSGGGHLQASDVRPDVIRHCGHEMIAAADEADAARTWSHREMKRLREEESHDDERQVRD